MTNAGITELADGLSNNDICELLNRIGDRINIYYGSANKNCLTSNFLSACVNGSVVQINCETTEYENRVQKSHG